MNDIATSYAKKVVSGEQIAGEKLKLSAQRHLDDLKLSKSDSFFYFYDEKLVEKFLNFASLVPDPELGKPIPLMEWQIFILSMIYGWRSKKTNNRRFNNVIISMARSQGKTYLASIVASYDFLVSSIDKSNQDFILSSNTTHQTIKLFTYVRSTIQMLRNTVFKKYEKDILDNEREIRQDSNKNKIHRISAEGGKFDSYHAKTAIFDEAGDQTTNQSFKKISSGQIEVDDPIFIKISTAYQNTNSPFRKDSEKVYEDIKNKTHELDNYLVIVFEQDSAKELFNELTWEKSNPLLGLVSKREKLLNGLISERDVSAAQGETNDFLVKNLNVWINAKKDSAFELKDIKNSVIDDFNMYKRQVYIGFDNSMTSDDTSLSFIFPYLDEDESKKWHIYQHSFIPFKKAGSIVNKEKQDGINYREMERIGYATVTKHERGLINDDYTFSWLMDFVEKYQLDVISFAYDAAHAFSFIKAIEETTDWKMLPIRQGVLSLNEPTKWLVDAFVEGKITRLDDQMMEYSLMNATLKNQNNGIMIDKDKATLKIDLVDAIVDALFEGLYHFENNRTINSSSEKFKRLSDKQKQELISEDFTF